MTYEYMPTPNNGRIKALCMGLFFGALVLFGASGLQDVIVMPWLFQFVSVCMLTVSILLMGRYLLRYYLYRIESVNGGVDFTVTEITRRGGTTVCRLGLHQLRAVKVWNAENKPPRGKKIYNYCVDARPADSRLLEFADGDDTIYIRFSPDAKMLEILENALGSREVTAE